MKRGMQNLGYMDVVCDICKHRCRQTVIGEDHDNLSLERTDKPCPNCGHNTLFPVEDTEGQGNIGEYEFA